MIGRALATLALLVHAAACNEPEPEPPPAPPESAPSAPTVWRVRLFERVHPTGLSIRGALRLNPGTSSEWDGPRLTLHVKGKILVAEGNGVAPGSLDGDVRVVPQEGSLELEPGPHRGGAKIRRRVTGPVLLSVERGTLRVIAELPAEDYVAGVVAAELPDAPFQAQRAQAILARSYASAQTPRHNDYDLCDLTHCQVFKGTPDKGTAVDAARSTSGQVLAHQGQATKIFYSSTCGGHTVGPEIPWGTRVTGLVGVKDVGPTGDAWCQQSPHFRWKAELTHKELRRSLRDDFGTGWSSPETWRVEHESSGWVRFVELGNPPKTLKGEEVHIAWGRRFGWSTVKSAHFVIRSEGEVIALEGSGLGHGVGLCQHGAMAMARAGMTGEQIVSHYFPELSLVSLSEL